jgi:DNA-binding IclR family transcriptional regulator
MSASELARATGMNRVTVHRALTTFKAHAFVRQTRPRAPYRLGYRLLELAEHVVTELELVRTGKPILDELCKRSGESCHLAVLDGIELVYVAKVESPHAVRLVSRVGSRMPLHSTALGKSILATLDPADATALLERSELERRTPHTLVTIPDLRAELDRVRTRGFAIDHEENEPGVHCVACAIPAPPMGPAAALSISGPSGRVPESRFPALGRLVEEAASTLSKALRR